MEDLLQPWYFRTGTSGPYQENSCLTIVEETKFHFLWAVLCFAFLTCFVCFPLVFYIFICVHVEASPTTVWVLGIEPIRIFMP